MKLNKLYKMQEELDKHIIEKHNIKMSKEELLDNTILALLVEVGELANTTRCFKHWSTKGMMDKEVVLDELADCLHFYLSIGNQVGLQCDVEGESFGKRAKSIEITFHMIYFWITRFRSFTKMKTRNYTKEYDSLGVGLFELAAKLKFTDEEVEQAYLKKHEENYKRQREGY